MTAESQQTAQERVTPWDLLPASPAVRSPEEKAHILARLQCMLAEARAMKGADHADA